MLGWKYALSLWSHQNTVYFQYEMQKVEIPANWVPRCPLNGSSRPTCHIEQTAPENSLFWPHITLRETCALS